MICYEQFALVCTIQVIYQAKHSEYSKIIDQLHLMRGGM